MGKTIVARITVVAEDKTASDEAATRLLKELHDLDEVEHVEQASLPGAPDGARSSEALAIGTLVLTMVAQPEVITTVLTYLADWRSRQRRSDVTVRIGDQELSVTNATGAQADKIIDAFIEKGLHSDS